MNADIYQVKSILENALSSMQIIEQRVSTTLAQLRDTEIRLRRARSRHFPSEYFADVAWDILLELDRAERLNRTFSVTEVGACAAIPLATLLRYVSKLAKDGFVVRARDCNDGRRILLSLTEHGRACLASVFSDTLEVDLRQAPSTPRPPDQLPILRLVNE